eukprot:gene17661-24009_t
MAENYECVSKILEGAYGVVWKARSKVDNRVVAVKQIKDIPQNEEVGCIFMEMVQGKALFPGKSPHEQLWLILRSMGLARSLKCGTFHTLHTFHTFSHVSRLHLRGDGAGQGIVPRKVPPRAAMAYLEVDGTAVA